MSHESKLAVLRSNHLCMNCFSSSLFVKQCKSVHRCKRCQRPHHTLLHVDSDSSKQVSPTPTLPNHVASVLATPTEAEASTSMHFPGVNPAALEFVPSATSCKVSVSAPDGTHVEARALLDIGSSASFISECLVQTLRLSRTHQRARISGVAGIHHHSTHQTVATFSVSSIKDLHASFEVVGIVVPKVTCDIPFAPVPLKREWNHLDGLELADPGFGCPGKIDLLLGIDVFVRVVRHGRRCGPPGSPINFETHFEWVFAGSTDLATPVLQIATCHTTCVTGDALLQKSWETEECQLSEPTLTPEERLAMQHFKTSHTHADNGRFVVPLPRRHDVRPLGESRSQA